MKNEFRLAIAAILLLLPNTGRAQWLTQTFDLKDGWNAIYLHVDASHTDIEGALGYDQSTINQSPVDQIWAWTPKPNSIQFIQSPQAPVDKSSRWSEWHKDEPVSSELKKIRGNTGYLVHANLQPNQTYKLRIKGKPVLPRYEWTTSGLNFIGFSTPSISPPNFDQYLVHSPELHRNGEIYLYNGGALSDGTNPARLFSLRSNEVRRGEAMWIRGTAGQYSNYFGPLKVTLQNIDGVHFGDSDNNYRIIVRNMSSQSISINLSPVRSESPPSGQPSIIDSPTLLVMGELNETTLLNNYSVLNSAGKNWELKAKNEIGSSVEIVLGLDRSKMNNFTGSQYAGILRITDKIPSSKLNGGDSLQGMTQIDLQVTATVPSMEGLWVGEAIVNEVRHDLTEYKEEENNDINVTSSASSSRSFKFPDMYLSNARNLTLTGWTRLRGTPVAGELYGIVGEKNGSYLAVNRDNKLVFKINNDNEITTSSLSLNNNDWNHFGVTFEGGHTKNTISVNLQRKLDSSFQIKSIKKNPEIYEDETGTYILPPLGTELGLVTEPPNAGFPNGFIITQTAGGGESGPFTIVNFETTQPHKFYNGDYVKIEGISNANFISEESNNNVFKTRGIKDNLDWDYLDSNTKFYVIIPGNIGLLHVTESGAKVSKIDTDIHEVQEIIELDNLDGHYKGESLVLYSNFFEVGDQVIIEGGVDAPDSNTHNAAFNGKIFKIIETNNLGYNKIEFTFSGNAGLGDLYNSQTPQHELKIKKAPFRLVELYKKSGYKVGDEIQITLANNAASIYNDIFTIKQVMSEYMFGIMGANLDSEPEIITPNNNQVTVSKTWSGLVQASFTGENINEGDTVIIRGVTGDYSSKYNGIQGVKTINTLNDGNKSFTFEVDKSVGDPQGTVYMDNVSTYVKSVTVPQSFSIDSVSEIYVDESEIKSITRLTDDISVSSVIAVASDSIITCTSNHHLRPGYKVEVENGNVKKTYDITENNIINDVKFSVSDNYDDSININVLYKEYSFINKAVSGDTISINTDAVNVFKIGDKINLKNTTSNYFNQNVLTVIGVDVSSGKDRIDINSPNQVLEDGGDIKISLNPIVKIETFNENNYRTGNIIKLNGLKLNQDDWAYNKSFKVTSLDKTKFLIGDITGDLPSIGESFNKILVNNNIATVEFSLSHGYSVNDQVRIWDAGQIDGIYYISSILNNGTKFTFETSAQNQTINSGFVAYEIGYTSRAVGEATVITSGHHGIRVKEKFKILNAPNGEFDGIHECKHIDGRKISFNIHPGTGSDIVRSVSNDLKGVSADLLAEVEIYGDHIFQQGDTVRFTNDINQNDDFHNKSFIVTEAYSYYRGEPQGNSGFSYIMIQLPDSLLGDLSSTSSLHIEKVGGVKFYLNGDIVESYDNDEFELMEGISNTYFGKTNEAGTPYQGDIKNFKIYSRRTLSDSEILDDYEDQDLSLIEIMPQVGPVNMAYQNNPSPTMLKPISRNNKFGKVLRPYKLRFILHHDNGGSTRLLQRVYQGFDDEGNIKLTNREATLDFKRISSASRMSVVHLPYNKENYPWVCNGTFGFSGTLKTDVFVPYNNHSSNPFLHTYHPDHDNLDNRFQDVKKIGHESWSVNREIKFKFADNHFIEINENKYHNINNSSSKLINGVFSEYITLKGKQITFKNGNNQISRNETKQYEVRGSFVFSKISDINNLTIK